MHLLNITTLLLIIIGGINWLFVGVFGADLIGSALGGDNSGLTRIAFVLVGLSAIYQLMPLFQAVGSDEITAERGRPR